MAGCVIINKRLRVIAAPVCGEMSERLKEPVLKTGDVQTSVGSNPTLSAILFAMLCFVAVKCCEWES